MAKASKAAPTRATRTPRGRARPVIPPNRRTLASFGRLFAAETFLLQSCKAGRPAIISDAMPGKQRGKRIRGDFVRFLALGGDAEALPYEAGLAIEGAYIEGFVDLTGCATKGGLRFTKCRFENEIWAHGTTALFLCLDGSEAPGLDFENCTITGNLFLTDGFRSTGEVRLNGAQIGGNLECQGASFENERIAINMQAMEVKRAFMWRDVKAVSGRIDLVAAHVATLADDIDSWRLATNVVLDGFRYDRIDSREISAAKRVPWLRLQDPGRFDEIFWPQPWEHLAKVLREMGHSEDAKVVLIEKQKEMRKVGLIGQRPVEGQPRLRRAKNLVLNSIHRMFHSIYGALAGFGYRPLRTVGWMALVWFASGLVYHAAAANGLIGPTNSGVYVNADLNRCAQIGEPPRPHWTTCSTLPAEYTPFDPFIYSLDVVLPLLDLKQENEWRPIVHGPGGSELPYGHGLRFLMWFETMFGWITSLLLVSALGRLAQKD
jgi:hypothetical protein